MSWRFEIETGRMYWPDGRLAGHGYSGNGEGMNNPEMQDAKAHGPIPRGYYSMQMPFNSPEHGPVTIRLIPFSGNEMYDRDGFLIHGDKIGAPGTASKGCIIMPHDVRVLMGSDGDKLLRVVPFPV